MSKPVHVLQPGAEAKEIVNIAAIAVVDALFHGYVLEIDALQKKVLIVDDFPSEVRLGRT
jgi:hypothetical protein